MKKKSIIFVLIIIFCVFYLFFENAFLEVTYYEINSDKTPDNFDNYKIAHISDFHNDKSKILTDDLVNKLESEKPNIIVITGDLIDSNKTDIDTSINFIKRIKGIAAIYYVTGNHEAKSDSYNNLKEQLIKNDVNILDGKVEVLKIGNDEINLIGIADPQRIHNEKLSNDEKVRKELESIKYDKSKYSILLFHRPELFDVFVDKEVDLLLTGHAHGGQNRIPFIGGLVAPNQGLFPKYTSGLFEENNTSMIVNRGIGNSILPFRINNRPELVIVTLNRN